MDRFFPKVAFTKDPSPLWFFFPKFHGFPSTHVDPYRAATNHEAANQHKPHLFGKKHIIYTTIPVGPKVIRFRYYMESISLNHSFKQQGFEIPTKTPTKIYKGFTLLPFWELLLAWHRAQAQISPLPLLWPCTWPQLLVRLWAPGWHEHGLLSSVILGPSEEWREFHQRGIGKKRLM